VIVVARVPNAARKSQQDCCGFSVSVHQIEIKQSDLESRCRRFREMLANMDLTFQSEALALYQLLWSPAAEELRRAHSVVIIPDGPLWEMPFQSLMPTSGHYLIEQHSISYAPSLTALRELARLASRRGRQTADRRTLLAVGNPTIPGEAKTRALSVFMDESLGPLPDAENQVVALKQIYGENRSAIYVGQAATEERIKADAAKYSILNFATHCLLDNANPIYSHLVLSTSPGSREDGLLEAWEVMNLDLNADLAVLSACETARGKISPGEGVIGLAWAFFVAGCPSIVVTQWKVESSSTTELVVAFHRNLKYFMSSPAWTLKKVEALRSAALKLIRSEKYKHPFYWAGFVLVGDGS